jgi:hypothetical protein
MQSVKWTWSSTNPQPSDRDTTRAEAGLQPRAFRRIHALDLALYTLHDDAHRHAADPTRPAAQPLYRQTLRPAN